MGRRGAGPTARGRLQGAARVVAAGVLWGTTGTARALAPPGADPLGVGAARLAVGAAALLAAAALRGGLGSLRRSDWPRVWLAAACVAAYQPLFFAGVARAGVAVGTLVGIGSAPVVAGLLSGLVRREWPGRRWLAATALAVAGCALLSGIGSGGAPTASAGVALAVAAGAAYAGYTVVGKELVGRYRAEAVTARVFAAAALLLSPALALGQREWLREPRGLAVALHLGLVATAAAYLLFTRGLAQLPAPVAATLSLSEPLTAALLGMAVLGERLTLLGWAGAAAITLGIALLTRQAPEAQERAAAAVAASRRASPAGTSSPPFPGP